MDRKNKEERESKTLPFPQFLFSSPLSDSRSDSLLGLHLPSPFYVTGPSTSGGWVGYLCTEYLFKFVARWVHHVKTYIFRWGAALLVTSKHVFDMAGVLAIEMCRFDATRRFLPSLSRQKMLRVVGSLLVPLVMGLGKRVALCRHSHL